MITASEGFGLRQYLTIMLPKLPKVLAAIPKKLTRRLEIFAWRRDLKLTQGMEKRLKIRAYMERGFDTLHSYAYQPYDGRTLIIRGDDDPHFQKDHDQISWGNLLPHATMVRVPGFAPVMVEAPLVQHIAAHVQAEMDDLTNA